MAEEHGFQEGHRLCANNCGFFGSPMTMDLCSKCYRDFCVNEQASSPKSCPEKSSLPVSASCLLPQFPALSESSSSSASHNPVVRPSPAAEGKPNRCSSCRKRVGLTGFKCRCGSTFCPTHRYPEHHACPFDFKKTGREAIARDNPVVKAEKLERL